MDAELDQITDAVIAELQTLLAGWGQPALVPLFADVPEYDAANLATVHLSVVPIQTTQTRVARKRNQYDHEIHLDLRQRTKNSPVPNRVLKQLAAQFADYWLQRKPSDYPTATCTIVETSPAFQTEALNKLGIFAAVCALTFQVVRAPQ